MASSPKPASDVKVFNVKQTTATVGWQKSEEAESYRVVVSTIKRTGKTPTKEVGGIVSTTCDLTELPDGTFLGVEVIAESKGHRSRNNPSVTLTTRADLNRFGDFDIMETKHCPHCSAPNNMRVAIYCESCDLQLYPNAQHLYKEDEENTKN